MRLEATEKEIQSAILDYLAAIGIFAWRANTGAVAATYNGKKRFIRYGPRGQPDIIGILPTGRMLGIEVKARRGRPTVEQSAFLDNINRHGGLGIVARSVDDVMAVITRVR